VHMEADRKADNGNAGFSLVCHPEERITYRVGNKVLLRSYILPNFFCREIDFVCTQGLLV